MATTSKKIVKILVDTQGYLSRSTTIKYGDKIFKLETNHRNGSSDVFIYMLTECGFVRLYANEEIVGIEYVSYIKGMDVISQLTSKNYQAMVDHIKKVFG